MKKHAFSFNLEQGLKGQYKFDVGTMLKQAWHACVSPNPVFILTLILCFVVVYLVQSTLTPGFSLTLEQSAEPQGIQSTLANVLATALTAPLWAALDMMGLHNACGMRPRSRDMLRYFKVFLPVALLAIINNLLIQMGLLLLVVPGLYIAVATSFTFMIMLTFRVSAWQAIVLSTKAVHKRWFDVFGIMLLMTLVLFIGAVTVIGLVWTIPLFYTVKGYMFRCMFEVPLPASVEAAIDSGSDNDKPRSDDTFEA